MQEAMSPSDSEEAWSGAGEPVPVRDGGSAQPVQTANLLPKTSSGPPTEPLKSDTASRADVGYGGGSRSHAPDAKLNSSQSVAQQQPLREDMVEAAVAFLKNPRVKSSPLEQKASFLLQRKGLTEAELEVAMRRAGLGNRSTAEHRDSSRVGAPRYASPASEPAELSLKAFGFVVFLCMGAHAAISYLIRTYAKPIIWPDSQPSVSDRLAALEEQVKATERRVGDQVGQFCKALDVIKKFLKMQTNEYKECQKHAVSQQQGEDARVLELRKSISTLKHLLPTIPNYSRFSRNVSDLRFQSGCWADVKNELEGLKNTIKLLTHTGQLGPPSSFQPCLTSSKAPPDTSTPPIEATALSDIPDEGADSSTSCPGQADAVLPPAPSSSKNTIPAWQREKVDNSTSIASPPALGDPQTIPEPSSDHAQYASSSNPS